MSNYYAMYKPEHPKATKKGYVREHILVAEKALGKHLPSKAVVHHVDGDGFNNKPDNLVICPNQKYHMLLHTRTRVLKAGGDPNTQKICSTCKTVKDKEEFSLCSHSPDDLQYECKNCNSIRNAVLFNGKLV